MRMSTSFSQRLRQVPHLAQSLRLTSQQRLVIQSKVLQLRLGLIEALRETRYEPRADCPKCYRKLTPIEIVQGFNDNPTDYTTCCSACHTRFNPELRALLGDYGEVTMPFYCDAQTLAQLTGRENLSPEQLRKEEPDIYHSAILHHGGLRQAFGKLGIVYTFDEMHDQADKIKPFLGRLPDTVIADCANLPVTTVRKLRKELAIPRYTHSNLLGEEE